MNYVEPIRDKEKIQEIKRCAQKLGKMPYMLMLLGFNTGLRVSDLLRVKVRDICEVGYIVMREKKTGKRTEIRFHAAIVAELKRLLNDRNMDEYIFVSTRQGTKGKPISRNTAYKWVVDACRMANVKQAVGTHTLRKSYGYHFYQATRDISLLMVHFNHSSEAITLRYIGATQEAKNRQTERFKL